MNGDRWSWHGAVALTLALGVVFVLVEISGPWDPDPLTDSGANVLLTIVGALAAYLGFTVGGSSSKDEPDKDEPDKDGLE